MQRRPAVRVLVLVGVLTACAHRPALPTCGAGWAPLAEHHGPVAPWTAPDHAQRIRAVAIAGVDPALTATLSALLATRPGQRLAEAPLRDDLRRLWGLGVLSDAQLELADGVVTFAVTPRQHVARVVFAGAHVPRFALLPGAPYEPARLRRTASAAELAWIREGHLDARVVVEQAPRAAGVDVCVAARPGPRITLASVTFPGRRDVPARELAEAIHGARSAINHVGGIYDPEALAFDEPFLLGAFYDHGYVDAKLGTPRTRRHGPSLELAIPIAAGERYRLGAIVNPTHLPLALARGQVFSRAKIAAARDQLAARTGAEIDIASALDAVHHRIDLTFTVTWRWPWDAWRPWLVPSR